MSKKSFIDSVEVKNPCTEDWAQMQGNESVRFCSHCSKSVNNLSEMTRKEAIRLVRASGGNLCIRYVQNPVTRRPMFAEQLLQITRRAPRLATGVMTASMALSTQAWAQGGTPDPNTFVIDGQEIALIKDKKQKSPDEPESGSVTGTVTDMNGVVIPNISVELTGVSTGEVRSALTNDEGVYNFTDITAGEYTILLKGSHGFSDKTVANVKVNAGKVTIKNTSLDVQGLSVMVGVVATSVEYETPLVLAVKNGDNDLVKELIAQGANVNGKDTGKITPLFIAVEENNIVMVQLLLDYGAKANARDENKKTPLMRVEEDPEISKLLLRYGAKVDLRDREGNTALVLAAGDANAEVLRVLIDADADVNAQNKDGETAMMKAYSAEMVRMLLEAGARVDLKDDEGDTALDWAFSNEEIREVLISYGATGKVKPETEKQSTVVDSQPEPQN